jgi:DNA mismatch endonuclease, patch repair protein
MDVVDQATRSRMMASIGSRDTIPELRVRQFLHRTGLRFTLHRKGLPGTPDLVIPQFKTVVFVHGCFWHRHSGCRFATTPSTRLEFWQSKFEANVERDSRNAALLIAEGWQVLTTWECQTDDESLEQLFWTIVSNSTS